LDAIQNVLCVVSVTHAWRLLRRVHSDVTELNWTDTV